MCLENGVNGGWRPLKGNMAQSITCFPFAPQEDFPGSERSSGRVLIGGGRLQRHDRVVKADITDSIDADLREEVQRRGSRLYRLERGTLMMIDPQNLTTSFYLDEEDVRRVSYSKASRRSGATSRRRKRCSRGARRGLEIRIQRSPNFERFHCLPRALSKQAPGALVGACSP